MFAKPFSSNLLKSKSRIPLQNASIPSNIKQKKDLINPKLMGVSVDNSLKSYKSKTQQLKLKRAFKSNSLNKTDISLSKHKLSTKKQEKQCTQEKAQKTSFSNEKYRKTSMIKTSIIKTQANQSKYKFSTILYSEKLQTPNPNQLKKKRIQKNKNFKFIQNKTIPTKSTLDKNILTCYEQLKLKYNDLKTQYDMLATGQFNKTQTNTNYVKNQINQLNTNQSRIESNQNRQIMNFTLNNDHYNNINNINNINSINNIKSIKNKNDIKNLRYINSQTSLKLDNQSQIKHIGCQKYQDTTQTALTIQNNSSVLTKSKQKKSPLKRPLKLSQLSSHKVKDKNKLSSVQSRKFYEMECENLEKQLQFAYTTVLDLKKQIQTINNEKQFIKKQSHKTYEPIVNTKQNQQIISIPTTTSISNDSFIAPKAIQILIKKPQQPTKLPKNQSRPKFIYTTETYVQPIRSEIQQTPVHKYGNFINQAEYKDNNQKIQNVEEKSTFVKVQTSVNPVYRLDTSINQTYASDVWINRIYKPETLVNQSYKPQALINSVYKPETQNNSVYRPQTLINSAHKTQTPANNVYKIQTPPIAVYRSYCKKMCSYDQCNCLFDMVKFIN